MLTQRNVCISRLYSEKAYVLSRGFVRRALEIPLGGGFDEVVKNIYYTNGRLRKVVESSRWLVESSKNVKEGEENDEVAVPKLTPGGIIMLTRTLDKLEALLLSASEQSPK
jgi:ubiquitin-conjugating enzyme E2 O